MKKTTETSPNKYLAIMTNGKTELSEVVYENSIVLAYEKCNRLLKSLSESDGNSGSPNRVNWKINSINSME